MSASVETNKKIKAWLPTIYQVRKDLGLTAQDYPDAVVLAVAELGKEMGASAKALSLTGETGATLMQFFMYLERYKNLHEGNPEYVALLWVSGQQDLSAYKKLLTEEGGGAASAFLLTLQGGAVADYMVRFGKAYSYWSSGSGDAAIAALPPRPGDVLASAEQDVLRTSLGGIIRRPGITVDPGCSEAGGSRVPLPEPRASHMVDTDRKSSLRGAERVQAYIAQNYVSDLEKSLQTLEAYNQQGRAHYNDKKLRVIRGFVEDAAEGEVGLAIRTTLHNAAVSFVKPLVDPIIRNAWGQVRRYAAGPKDARGNRTRLVDPVTGEQLKRRHLGIDYETRDSLNTLGVNQLCYAITDGEVVRAEGSRSYGYVLYIKHAGGVSTRYAHLDEFLVRKGDKVEKGQAVGRCGTTEGVDHADGSGWTVKSGRTTPHLHFEIRLNVGVLSGGKMLGGVFDNAYNISIDPEPLLEVAPNPGEAVEEVSPALASLREAGDAFSDLATQAVSKETAAIAAANFDTCKALERGVQFMDMVRYDFYGAQARNLAVQTEPIIAQSSLPPGYSKVNS